MNLTLDLTNVFSFVDAAATPALLLLGGWAITTANNLASKYFKLKPGSQAQDDLDQAMIHVGALATEWYHSLESHNKSITLPSSVATTIAAHVLTMAPAAESVLGYTPETLAPLVTAQAAQVLHWFDKPLGQPPEVQAVPVLADPLAPLAPAEPASH